MQWLINYVNDKAINDNEDSIYTKLTGYYFTHNPGSKIDEFYTWIAQITPDKLYEVIGVAYNP